MASHIIDIEDCETGTYTRVRKLLNEELGGPEAWEYDKPLFTLEASDEEFEDIQDALDIDGISFLPGHHTVTEIEEEDDEDEDEEYEDEDEDEDEDEEEEEEEEEEEAPPAPPAPPAPAPAPVTPSDDGKLHLTDSPKEGTAPEGWNKPWRKVAGKWTK